MAINLKLATLPVGGVTDFTTRVFGVADNNTIVDINSVNALVDRGFPEGDFSLRLPLTPEDGNVVEFKNLLNERRVVNLPGLNIGVDRGLVQTQLTRNPGDLTILARNAGGIRVNDFFIFMGDLYRVDVAVQLFANLWRFTIDPALLQTLPTDSMIRFFSGNTEVVITQGALTQTIPLVVGVENYGILPGFNINAPVTIVANITGPVAGASLMLQRNTVTIDRNGHNIDGLATDITTNTPNQVFRLVYINENIGWAAI